MSCGGGGRVCSTQRHEALQPHPKLHTPLALPIVLHLGGKTKVTNLDPHFIVEEEVPKFDVAVYNVAAVEVVHGQ